MLQASKEWQWISCRQRNRLLVDLGEELILCTPFRLRQLTQDAHSNPHLSINEAAYYQNVFAYLRSFSIWSEPQCCQIALNATAAKFYLLPVQAKSWFFESYTGDQPCTEAIVRLRSAQQEGDFFIVEQVDGACLCISLSPKFALDENLELEQFQAIKVLNDRVHPLISCNKISQMA
ncbi:cell division protein ZapC domain-containing protein [Pseudoalteromonas byunsanensis]|uniref:Cell division protein ZapC n=1 Tax=Pseudoalteromonas byunsanensis TaxID=327939 RepID=A0A1S1NAZ0_9GAMM|nr:cell division protein ZapC domain-containing protein [Pseudoalteromonas byunsanensis]OHU96700.1 cell division protein ZapC [Pseudoalteromonas byunsanensis]